MVTVRKRRSKWAAALGALMLTVVLSGCNNDDEPNPPDPTNDGPTQTEEPTGDPTTDDPTEDPTLSEQDQHIADARQAYLDYIDVYNIAAQEGFEPGEATADVISRTGGDMREAVVEDRDNYQEYNITRDGDSEVVSAEATDYSEGEGSVEAFVSLQVCLDNSDVDTLIDGEPQDSAGGRTVQDVELQKHDGTWLVWDSQRNENEDC